MVQQEFILDGISAADISSSGTGIKGKADSIRLNIKSNASKDQEEKVSCFPPTEIYAIREALELEAIKWKGDFIRMHKNVIFCFSGTGNCLNLAKMIAHDMGGADIVMMRRPFEVTDVRGAERVGFVFPCFGGGAPVDVLTYAKSLKFSPDSYTFAVSMSSSYAGVGLHELNKIIPLNYWRTVRHHCSCIWLFPHTMMLPHMSVQEAQKQSEKQAIDIAYDVMLKKTTDRKPPYNVLNAAESKAFSKITGKKAAEFAVSDACIGCGQCERLCPRGNIRIQNGKAVIGTDCVQCLGCLQFCPQEAISIGEITKKREHYHNPNITPEDLVQKVIHI